MKFINTRAITVLIFFLFFNTDIFGQLPVADFTVLDADGCAPHTASFTSTSTGGPLTYVWEFGDPNSPGTSTSANPSHIYTVPGQYNVKLTVTNANGSDSIIKTNFITVFNGPSALYTTSRDTICSGESITFTDASTQGDGAINQWEWTFNDGTATVTGSNTVTHPFINFDTTTQSFIAVFKPIDINGCNSIASSDTIFVLPAPTASFNYSATSCVFPFTVSFTNTSTGPSIYSWNFGDPSSGVNDTSSQFQPSHTYNTGGSYLVTLTNGVAACRATDTITINLFPPVSSFTMSDSIPCLNDTVFFTNLSTPPPLSSMTYLWTFGPAITSNAINPKHVYTIPGSYTVSLKTSFGGCSSISTHSVNVLSPPSTGFTASDLNACDTPFPVSFSADSLPLNVGWQWDFGDPASGASNSSTIREPIHIYNNFGSYPVKLIVTDIFGCRDSVEIFNYILIRKPIIGFTMQDSGCVGSTFDYSATVISPADPVITNYSWDFGDGSPIVSGANADTSHQFNTVGVFDVTLTITTQSGCTATLTNTGFARVGTIPNAQIDSVLSSICFKGTVSFTDLTAPPVTGWFWQFGDNKSSTEQNPSHKYEFDTSGVAEPFDIILIAYYNGCADSDTVVNMVTVLAPVPLFDTTMNCLFPDSVKFTDLSGGADSLFWNFGDGSPIDSISTNPSHIYAGRGDYNVVLTAKNNASGCSVDTTLIISVREIKANAISNLTQVCHPGSINFSGSASQDAVNWFWTFGEGIPNVLDTSYEADTVHIYTRPGFYTATLTTNDIYNCLATDTQRVHIIGPTANFTADKLGGCSPVNVTFKDSSQIEGGAITNWTWNYGTGEPPENTNIDSISHNYNSSGLYSVTLIVTDVNGCSDLRTAINFINPTKPTASILIPDTGCSKAPELFTGNAGPIGSYAQPVTYIWNFGDGQSFSDTSETTNHVYTSNGDFNVRLKVVDANGCVDSTNANIFLFTTSADFTFDTLSECVVDQYGIKKANVKVDLFSTETQYVTHAIYDWDMTVAQRRGWTSSNFTFNYNSPPGIYDITLILTNDLGCKDTLKKPGAIIVAGPTGSFSFVPDSGCSPLTVNFTGTSVNSNIFSWDFGDGSVVTGTSLSSISHTYTTVDTYVPQFLLGFPLTNETCYLPVDSFGAVTVTSTIGVDIVEDTIFVREGEKGVLTVNVLSGSPPYTYNWTPANQVTNGPSSNTFLAGIEQNSAYYTVQVPYGTLGCSGSDRVYVVLIPETCEKNLDSIPNAFSPNGDAINDTYYIKDLCNFDGFNIKIFNRWGKIIFESTNPIFVWDGNTSSGTEASEGVYYYVLKAKTRDLHGYINLIRGRK